MIFNTYYSEQEIARLMSRIPNFRPRGYGVFTFNEFEYTARKLITVLTEAEPLTAFNAELIGRTVNAVILNTDRSVSLILTNNQFIRKESDDGANYPSTESGQSDTAHGQRDRNSCQ